MASEEKITNKIVPIETILQIANYMEDQKEEYERLFEREAEKNKNLKYNEQVYEYKGEHPKVEYTIKLKDGKEMTQPDYNWFVANLNNLKAVERISIFLAINYRSNINEQSHYEYSKLYAWLHFSEENVTIHIDGKNMEEQTHRIHSYVRGVIENNEERYNKTVKSRKIRVQSFCLTIGFVLSYIIYFILLGSKSKLPISFANLIENKMVIIFGQWFISAIIGNVFGLPIMLNLYRSILPKAKYSHYSKSAGKSVYVDNIEDYISHNEVQIGKFANNAKKRELIEKIYKITSKLVLVQVAISVILFLVLK